MMESQATDDTASEGEAVGHLSPRSSTDDEDGEEEKKRSSSFHASSMDSSVARPHEESELVNQLVLAKLSNLEHHQKRAQDREHRSLHRRDALTGAAPGRTSRRRRRLLQPHPTAPSAALQHQRTVSSATTASASGRGDPSSDLLSPTTAFPSPPSSPVLSPNQHAARELPHRPSLYELRELSKPYRQGELLLTLADDVHDSRPQLEDSDDNGSGNRTVSADGSVGSGAHGGDSGDLSDADVERMEDEAEEEEEEQQQAPQPSAVVESDVQQLYNAAHAQREAIFPSAGRTADLADAVQPSSASATEAPLRLSAPASPPALIGIPTVTASLRKERGASSRSQSRREWPAEGKTAEAVEPDSDAPAKRAAPSEIRVPQLLLERPPAPSGASPAAPASPSPAAPLHAVKRPPTVGTTKAADSSSATRPAPPRQTIAAIATDYPLSILLAEGTRAPSALPPAPPSASPALCSGTHSPHPPVLCCAVLCCAVLCCAVLCCAVLCCALCAVLRCTPQTIP